MRELVLGIISVAMLQLGFIGYTMLQEPLDVAVAPVGPEIEQRDPVLDWLDVRPESSETETDPETSIARAVSPRSSVPLPAKPETPRSQGRSVTPRKFAPPQQWPPDDFRTVVISYTGRPGSADCDVPAAAKPKGRSLAAKAAPIVQKPWELMKTVASKLK